jgi:hypothetical protein
LKTIPFALVIGKSKSGDEMAAYAASSALAMKIWVAREV